MTQSCTLSHDYHHQKGYMRGPKSCCFFTSCNRWLKSENVCFEFHDDKPCLKLNAAKDYGTYKLYTHHHNCYHDNYKTDHHIPSRKSFAIFRCCLDLFLPYLSTMVDQFISNYMKIHHGQVPVNNYNIVNITNVGLVHFIN